MSFSSSLSDVFNHSLYEGQERSPAVCQCFFYVCAHAFIRRRRCVIATIRVLLWCRVSEKGFGVALRPDRVSPRGSDLTKSGHSIFSERRLSLSLSVRLCVSSQKIHTSFHQGPKAFHLPLLPLSLLPFLADKLTILTPIPPQAIYFPLVFMETEENAGFDHKNSGLNRLIETG